MKHYGDELQSVISQLLRVRAVSTNSCHTHILQENCILNPASLLGLVDLIMLQS